jgi:hypothetical protein
MSVITLTGSITVGEALLDEMPDEVPESVEKAAKYLKSTIEQAQEGLTDRFDGKADTAIERAFDVLVDRIWIVLRARLEFWHCYTLPGVTMLSAEEQVEAEIDKNRKLAMVAKDLLARLFANGTDFLRLSYPQQAVHMAARLRYIDTRGLQEEFKELIGPAPVVLARVCQRRYESMVKARAARDTAVNVNLKPLRASVAWAVENYAAALLGTLPDGDAEWAKLVLAALQPMVATDGPRSSSSGESPEEQLPETIEEIEQLLGLELPSDDEPPLVDEGAEQN